VTEVVQAGLLVLKIKFEVNNLVLDTVHFLLQFVDVVEDHHPLIGLEAIRDQGCQFLRPVFFQARVAQPCSSTNAARMAPVRSGLCLRVSIMASPARLHRLLVSDSLYSVLLRKIFFKNQLACRFLDIHEVIPATIM